MFGAIDNYSVISIGHDCFILHISLSRSLTYSIKSSSPIR